MRLLVLGEDDGHGAVVGYLTQHVLRAMAEAEGADWFFDNLSAHLQWRGEIDLSSALGDVVPGLRYTHHETARLGGRGMGPATTIGGRPIKLRGHFDGRPGADEAQMWRYVLAWALGVELDGEPEDEVALIIARDTDGQPARAEGLQQAIDEVRRRGGEWPILVAMPHQDLETWLVLGFAPEDEQERARLEAVKGAISFDPTRAPERLTAKPNDAATDAKRVLNRLVYGEDQSRPVPAHEIGAVLPRCFADGEHLERFGGACGLNAFIRQVRGLAPLMGLSGEPLAERPR